MGHSLTGATIALAAVPMTASRWQTVSVFGLCVVAASAPDLPFPGWGHDNYFRSHSIWYALIGGMSLFVVMSLIRDTVVRAMPKWLPLCLMLCWWSHILLDSMYANTPGLIVGWPLDKQRLALPVPWLHTLNREGGWMNWHNLRVVLLELVTFGPILLAGIAVRRFICRYRFDKEGHQ